MKIRRALLLFGGGIKRLLNLANLFSFEADHTTPTAGVLPVYKPYGGLGDFTVVRGSSATYVDSDGIIKEAFEVTDTELVTNGDFEDGDTEWILDTGWTISNGVASNNGTDANIVQNDVCVVGTDYFMEVEVTASNDSGRLLLYIGNSITKIITSPTTRVHTIIGTATSGQVIVRGDQGWVGSIDNVSVKEISYDIARIDYTNGVAELLTEPQSTNLVTYSEDFSNSSWGKGGSVSASSPIDINFPVAASTERFTYAFAVDPQGKTFSYSIGLKGTGTLTLFVDTNGGSPYQIVATEQITLSETGDLFTLTGTFTSTAIGVRVHVQRDTQNTCESATITRGAQLEELPYATSYIPTNGSTVTRLQDTITDGANVNVINSEEGVLFFEGSALVEGDAINRYISLNDGTSNNRIYMGWTTQPNRLQIVMFVGGAIQFNETYTSFTQIDNNKIAFKWKENDLAMWINGVELYTVLTGISFPINTLDTINFSHNSKTNTYFFGRTRELKVYDRALTDEELEQITTL